MDPKFYIKEYLDPLGLATLNVKAPPLRARGSVTL